MCWSQTNTYRYIQRHSVPAKTKWEIQSINRLHYKLKKQRRKVSGGRVKKSYLWWLIKAFFKKEGCILHIQWKLKFHQVRLRSLKREVKKNPLGGRRTEEPKQKKKRKGRCVSARGVWGEGPRGRGGTLRREETAQHTTRTHQRETVAQIKYAVRWKQRREGRCFFLFMYN